MTIKELINILQEYEDQNAQVLTIDVENWHGEVMFSSVKHEYLYADEEGINMIIKKNY